MHCVQSHRSDGRPDGIPDEKKMLIMPSVFFALLQARVHPCTWRLFHSLPGYPKALIRLLKFFGWSIVAVFCGLLLGLSGAFLYLSPGLPSVEALRSIQLQIPLRVYSSDNKLIAEFGEMRRTPIRFADIPPISSMRY